jgi:hypothetical protein
MYFNTILIFFSIDHKKSHCIYIEKYRIKLKYTSDLNMLYNIAFSVIYYITYRFKIERGKSNCM